MAGIAAYRIADEPAPGRWTHLAVDPLWPLLALMFAGPWLSWPWSVLNAHAVGSPTRWRETALVLAGFAGTLLMALGLGMGVAGGLVPRGAIWVFLLLVTLWKLGVGYWVFVLQQRTFDLYRYFGGRVRSGMLVVVACFFFNAKVLALLPGMWRLVLG